MVDILYYNSAINCQIVLTNYTSEMAPTNFNNMQIYTPQPGILNTDVPKVKVLFPDHLPHDQVFLEMFIRGRTVSPEIGNGF